jgi:hypothetical protein
MEPSVPDWGNFVATLMAAIAALASAVAAWKTWQTTKQLTKIEKHRSIAELYDQADKLICQIVTIPGDSDSLRRNYLVLNQLLKRSRPLVSKRLFGIIKGVRDKAEHYTELDRQRRSGCYDAQQLVSPHDALRDEIIGLRPRLEAAYIEAVSG